MLVAGLLYGRDGGVGEGWDRCDRALSLDFFARVVRALGRHLAPVSVPSPLVRCGRCSLGERDRGRVATGADLNGEERGVGHAHEGVGIVR